MMVILQRAFPTARQQVRNSIKLSGARCLATQSAAVLDKCPDPSCPCAAMPPDLDIDHDGKLQGTVAFYKRHLLVSTADSNWSSRLEDDESSLAGKIKKAFGKGGPFLQSGSGTLVSAVTWPTRGPLPRTLSLFPDARELSIKGWQDAEPSTADVHDAINQNIVIAQSTSGDSATEKPITSPTVLICGHGQRDERCGIMGPLLAEEFDRIGDVVGSKPLDCGLITHIGGHKYAGNVIVYLPKHPESHPLAGAGIWYGRVEPRHVEGILTQTVRDGKIIKELFRGGIDSSGRPLEI